MTTEPARPSRERYGPGYEARAHELMTERTAARFADYVLPHLRRGMRLLDVGCGPGAITLDLAEAVSPGETVGVDIAPVQVERARALAVERGVAGVRFEPADAYALPFPAASFDVVVATNLLQHLGDPPRALREFRRVLRPGGLAAVTDPDWTWRVFEPPDPRLEQLNELWVRAFAHNGGSPGYARTLRRLPLEAGFARAEVDPRLPPMPPAAYARDAGTALQLLAGTILGQGWADAAELDAIAAALATWGQRPDAQVLFVIHRAIGWVDA